MYILIVVAHRGTTLTLLFPLIWLSFSVDLYLEPFRHYINPQKSIPSILNLLLPNMGSKSEISANIYKQGSNAKYLKPLL